MKTALVLSLVALFALPSAHAQILRPEAVNGAVLGGIAGAVIGHNSGDLRNNAWKGAAIGAGAGLILGEVAGNARASSRATTVPVPPGAYIYRQRPDFHVDVGYSRGYSGYGYGYGHRAYRYTAWGHDHGYRGSRDRWGYGYGVSYRYYPGYSDAYPYYDSAYGYRTGSAASSGLLLGALAGSIIGHNSGDFRHNGWRGAAWGAGAGWLLGSIVDANRRPVVYQEAPVVVQPAVAAPPAAAQPQQPITIINNYYNPPSPMSGANGLFGR